MLYMAGSSAAAAAVYQAAGVFAGLAKNPRNFGHAQRANHKVTIRIQRLRVVDLEVSWRRECFSAIKKFGKNHDM